MLGESGEECSESIFSSGYLLLVMNKKMNALIEAEVGDPDDGSFLPGEDTDWAATTFDP